MLGTGLSTNTDKNNKPLILGGKKQEWKYGLCSCCADPLATLSACFFPCFIQGKTYALASQNDTATVYIVVFLLVDLLGLGLCGNLYLRIKVREENEIRGSGCDDFCVSLCCGPCALVQTYRELL
ncbi:hypothetical protein MHBO_002306 [Bonamia ostreae]|uniref:PLAC8 family protein n=1 Tax=Bonamia ostreae TaxID=126728 RepID=A0ABV2ALU7_9EUKA